MHTKEARRARLSISDSDEPITFTWRLSRKMIGSRVKKIAKIVFDPRPRLKKRHDEH